MKGLCLFRVVIYVGDLSQSDIHIWRKRLLLPQIFT